MCVDLLSNYSFSWGLSYFFLDGPWVPTRRYRREGNELMEHSCFLPFNVKNFTGAVREGQDVGIVFYEFFMRPPGDPGCMRCAW